MSKNIGSFIFQLTRSGVWTNTFRMSSQQGDTPLITATKKGMIGIVKQLLDRRADSSSKDKVSCRRLQ